MRLSPDEFQTIYDQTARPLKAYLVRLVRNDALADELLQETFYKFLRADLEIDPAKSPKSYLFRIATNLANDMYRGKREAHVELDEASTAPLAPVQSNDSRDVERVLNQLKPRERELVWLAYAEGASHREIAEIIGVKEVSVRPMLHRARQHLAGLLRSVGFHERMMV